LYLEQDTVGSEYVRKKTRILRPDFVGKQPMHFVPSVEMVVGQMTAVVGISLRKTVPTNRRTTQ